MKPVITTFPSRLRLVTIPQPDAATTTALVLVGTGSSYESVTEAGLSHFLEHMCFKGTTRRPSARAIAEEFDAIGAVSNAFTSNEYTGYYAKGNPAHLSQFLDILGDIYVHSVFAPEEIEKEKGVIIEEINMYEDQLPHKAGEALVELIYGDQPAGRPIIGTKETVRSFTQNDFISYKQKHYHAENTTVIVVGPVAKQHVITQVRAAFKTIPSGVKSKLPKTVSTQNVFAKRLITRPSDQAHIAFGFRSVPLQHKDVRAYQLLATILGRGMSSRLFQLLREDLGVAYYVHADHEGFIDRGMFSITAGIDKHRINEILTAIVAELQLITRVLVSKEELAKATEFAVGMLRLGLEATDDQALFYGIPLVLGKNYKSPQDIEKEWRAVTPADIRRVARIMFVGNKTNLSIVGPYSDADIDWSIVSRL